MRKTLRRTEKISLWVALVSTALTGGLYLWLPNLPWWAYASAWLMLSAVIYQTALKQVALENVANLKRD